MKYSSVAWIGFTVHHDAEDPYASVTLKEIRKSLLLRIVDLDVSEDWKEAVAFDDTIREDDADED